MILEVPEKEAKSIIAALEKENAENKRFASRIFMRGKNLVIMVEAEDIVALRATVNSYMRYLQTIEGLQDSGE